MYDTFHERKKERTEYFYRFIYGWRLQDCVACMGTGEYDDNGSPPCGACDGTGKETFQGPHAIKYKENVDEFIRKSRDREIGLK